MLGYGGYTGFLNFCMSTLNGVVNTIIKCNSYAFEYNSERKLFATADSVRGTIGFNIPEIMYTLGREGCSDKSCMEKCVKVVVHELSHLDQDINPNRYAHDPQYHNFIEYTNNRNTVKWIFEHQNIIRNTLGEFTFSDDIETYLDIQKNGTGYTKTTALKTISYIMNRYFVSENSGFFNEYSTVFLYLSNTTTGDYTKMLIRNNWELIDPNILIPILASLRSYRSLKVYNRKCDNVFHIKLEVSENNRFLEQIIFRIPKELRIA